MAASSAGPPGPDWACGRHEPATNSRGRRRAGYRRAHQAHARAQRRRVGRDRASSGDAALQGRDRAATRPRHPRPESAGAQRQRSLPHPPLAARRRRAADHHADGARRRRPTAWLGSIWARTTTSPSRSACASWRARARRAPPAQARRRAAAAAVYRGAHLVADFDAVSITVDGAPVRLTRREFELLRFLVENRNRVLSRDRLLERVWGYDRFIETRSVDVHVGRLRAKLGQAGRADRNRRGVGLPIRGKAVRLAISSPTAIFELPDLLREGAEGALDAVPVRVTGLP